MSVERLRELAEKIDAFFARVAGRHPGEIACRAGCHDCCQPGLTVTGAEAAAIRAHLATLPGAQRAELAARPEGDRCAALASDGRCGIYHVRPLVCRSHGVPIRISRPGHLPVIDACPKNFLEHGPNVVDAGDVLDQTTLSTVLAAVDAAHAAATRTRAGQRVAITALLRGG